MEEQKNAPKAPSLLQSFIPILVLVALLAFSVSVVWGDDALSGANQIALLLSSSVAMVIGWRLGHSWKNMLKGATDAINTAMSAIIILLLIGALAGTWLISGIVPTMIYYGLQILSPTVFLFSACLISAIVSLATGSSWSTIATVGVALLGIGEAMGFNGALCAGAIISGAYFGDKMSPMSDTTNLAPAVAGTDLITHIKYMMFTTLPSIILTLIIFLVLGFFIETGENTEGVQEILTTLENSFNITPWLFLIPVIVVILIVKKMPAIPALFIGVLLGGIFAMIFQQDIILENGRKNNLYVENLSNKNIQYEWGGVENDELLRQSGGTVELTLKDLDSDKEMKALITLPNASQADSVLDIKYLGITAEEMGIGIVNSRSNYFVSSYRSIVNAMTVSTNANTGNADVDDLLGTGGMSGMLGTIWLIIVAMIFGGTLEQLGMLQTLTSSLIKKVKSDGGLVLTTAATCLGFNVTASDQYLAIVVPGKMYASEFKKRGLAPQNLSRTLEDTGTVTSVLVPWNTCGAAQSSVLGIATGEYFFYCFFNIISPIMTVAFAYLNIRIARK